MARSKARHLVRVVARAFDSPAQRPAARSTSARLKSSACAEEATLPICFVDGRNGVRHAHSGRISDHHWAGGLTSLSHRLSGPARSDLSKRLPSAGAAICTSWPLTSRKLSTAPKGSEDTASESNTAVSGLSDAAEAPPSDTTLAAELAAGGDEADVSAVGDTEDDASEHISGAGSSPSGGFKGGRPGRSERMRKTNEEMEVAVREKMPRVKILSTAQVNAELSQLSQSGKHLDVLATFHAWRRVREGDAKEGGQAGEGVTVSGGDSNEEVASVAPTVPRLLAGNEAVTWNYAMIALMRLGRPARAVEDMIGEMQQSGVQPNAMSFNTLMRVALRDRNAVTAIRCIAKMKEIGMRPDADAYSLAITLCAMEKRVVAAIEHLKGMLAAGLSPSSTSLNELLLACSRMRRSRDAHAILKEIQGKELAPLPYTLAEVMASATDAEDSECALYVAKLLNVRRIPIDRGCLLYTLNLAARSASPALAEQAWLLLVNPASQQPGSSSNSHSPASPLPVVIPAAYHLARIHTYAASKDLPSAFRCVVDLEQSLVEARAGKHAGTQAGKQGSSSSSNKGEPSGLSAMAPSAAAGDLTSDAAHAATPPAATPPAATAEASTEGSTLSSSVTSVDPTPAVEGAEAGKEDREEGENQSHQDQPIEQQQSDEHTRQEGEDLPSPSSPSSSLSSSLSASSPSPAVVFEELNPLTSLHPLSAALSSSVDGLDNGYYELERMHAEGELVSLAALNCVLAGCAFLRDVGRAVLTFQEIDRAFGLKPDIHSYNALILTHSWTGEAPAVEALIAQLKAAGLSPTQHTYDALVHTYMHALEAEKAVGATKVMLAAGFIPSRDLLVKLRLRCSRANNAEGVLFAEKTIAKLGHRAMSLDEKNRRRYLFDLPPVIDAKPMRRLRPAQ